MILLGKLDDIRRAAPKLPLDGALPPEAYWFKSVQLDGIRYTILVGGDEAAFAPSLGGPCSRMTAIEMQSVGLYRLSSYGRG